MTPHDPRGTTVYQSTEPVSATVNAGASGELIKGDGERIALIVAVDWAGAIGEDTTAIITSGQGSEARTLAVLDPGHRFAVLELHRFGDAVQRSIFATVATTNGAFRTYGVRARHKEK